MRVSGFELHVFGFHWARSVIEGVNVVVSHAGVRRAGCIAVGIAEITIRAGGDEEGLAWIGYNWWSPTVWFHALGGDDLGCIAVIGWIDPYSGKAAAGDEENRVAPSVQWQSYLSGSIL